MKIKKPLILALSVILVIFLGYCATLAITSYAESLKSFRLLQRDIKKLSRTFPGQCAYIIKDLQRPYLRFSYAQTKSFPAASVIKLPIAAAAYKAVKEGRFSIDKPVTITDADITGGSGELKTQTMPITLTYKELIEKMLSRSDNTATNKLIDLLGYTYLNEAFHELGLKHTLLKRKMMDFSKRKQGVENYTSARDIAFLLEKIDTEQLIDKSTSQDLLEMLKKQKIRDRIPRYLPNNVIVAHKTGLERSVVHDAGIIYSSKGKRLVCVLTKNVKSYAKAKRFIADLSLLLYNSMVKD